MLLFRAERWLSLLAFRDALMATLLYSGPGFQHILIHYNRKVTDHFLVKLEGLFEFCDDVRRRFMEHLDIEACIFLLDSISQASSSPAVYHCDCSAVFRDEFLVARDYRLDLTVFQVRIANESSLVFSLNDVQFNSPPFVFSAF